MALPRFFPRNHTAIQNCIPLSKPALEKILGNTIIGVYLDVKCEDNPNAFWVAEFLVNLLARLYPRISLMSQSQQLLEKLEKIAKDINPIIELKNDAPHFSVVIGTHEDAPENAIYPWAHGWLATISQSPNLTPAGHPNPYSSCVAASFAACEIFKQVFSKHLHKAQKPLGEFTFSLLDHGASAGENIPLPPIDIGDVALVGLGAVGNPAVWALARHEGLEGKLHLVDHENVDLSNLQRYILATDNDAKNETPKVEMASRELSNTNLVITPIKNTLEEFANSFKSNFSMPTICVSLDNEEGRRNAQALLPELVINGWTGDRCLGVSRHRFNEDAACLSCLYQPNGVEKSQTEIVAEEFGLEHRKAVELWLSKHPLPLNDLTAIAKKLKIKKSDFHLLKGKTLKQLYTEIICGETTIEIKREIRPVTVPLAYQSAITGILMACELIKQKDTTLAAMCQQSGYLIWEDIFKPLGKRRLRIKSKVQGCICGDRVYQGVYKKKWLS